MKWYQVWRSALRVQEADFRDILNWSEVSRRRALGWMAISGAVGYVLLLPVIMQRTAGLVIGESLRIGFLAGGIVLAPLIAILILMFYTWAAQFVALRMGGRGTSDEMMYAFSAFLSPTFILIALVSLITLFLGGWVSLIASFILSMYQLLGCVVAIMVVHDLPLQKGFAASIPVALVLALSLSGNIQSLLSR
jgi:hypothetical protein